MTLQAHNPSTQAAPLGAYSNGISAPGAGRWLDVAGQVGVRPDGTLATDFAAQAAATWQNLLGILGDAGMTPNDLVKLTHRLVRGDDLKDCNAASTLVIVQALARPEWQVEVEAVAWRA